MYLYYAAGMLKEQPSGNAVCGGGGGLSIVTAQRLVHAYVPMAVLTERGARGDLATEAEAHAASAGAASFKAAIRSCSDESYQNQSQTVRE